MIHEGSSLCRFRHLGKQFPDQVRELFTFFRFHAATIEMERMNVMADVQLSSQYKEWLSEHFDAQVHQVSSVTISVYFTYFNLSCVY